MSSPDVYFARLATHPTFKAYNDKLTTVNREQSSRMLGIKWSELFPSRGGFITFVLYISLFVFQGVFITASMKDGGGYAYNTTLVVFLSECVKFIASAVLYTLRRENKPSLLPAMIANYKLLLLYFIPSLLYCFYNNLSFVNLAHYDPTTYYILLQFRVVITAFIFQCLFKKQLTSLQWLSLAVLTLGCIIKNFTSSRGGDTVELWSQLTSVYTLLINFQNFCSCLAGTYNEYLLKKNGADVDIFLQNVFMYVDSIVCNFIVMLLRGQVSNLAEDFQSLGNIFVILIIFNNATVGIVTSFFLKNLNSILKTYASAIELVITAVVCYIIFGILITWSTVLSIMLVSLAVVLYARNPVNNTSTAGTSKDKKPLLREEEEV